MSLKSIYMSFSYFARYLYFFYCSTIWLQSKPENHIYLLSFRHNSTSSSINKFLWANIEKFFRNEKSCVWQKSLFCIFLIFFKDHTTKKENSSHKMSQTLAQWSIIVSCGFWSLLDFYIYSKQNDKVKLNIWIHIMMNSLSI